MAVSSWVIPSELPALSGDAAHVWLANVVTLASCEPYFESLLDDDERARGNKFHAVADRHRHIISRGLLRVLVAHYLGLDPHDVRLDIGAFGKPYVAPYASARVSFNVSHSGDLVLIALALDGHVGVDVERWNSRLDEPERERLAQSVFSANEFEALEKLASPEREGAFYAIWSRKEAYLKGTGAGISAGLGHFDVSADGDARLIADRNYPANVGRWRLYDLDVGAGYSAALAASVPHGRVEQWQAVASMFTPEGFI